MPGLPQRRPCRQQSARDQEHTEGQTATDGRASRWTCASLVHVGHQLRSLHIACLKVLDAKPSVLNHLRDRAVQVATSAQAPPERREAILPASDALVGRTTVFDEEEATVWPRNAPHLFERAQRIRDGAERP